MRTLIAFMLMVGVAWGGDLSDIATAEDYGLEDITGDVTTSIAIHPIGDTYTNEKGELCQDYNDGSILCGNTDSIPKITNNLSDTLESRIAALEAQVKELRQQVLPMSCLEYVRIVEFKDASKPPRGMISRMDSNGYFSWHKIKPECQ